MKFSIGGSAEVLYTAAGIGACAIVFNIILLYKLNRRRNKQHRQNAAPHSRNLDLFISLVIFTSLLAAIHTCTFVAVVFAAPTHLAMQYYCPVFQWASLFLRTLQLWFIISALLEAVMYSAKKWRTSGMAKNFILHHCILSSIATAFFALSFLDMSSSKLSSQSAAPPLQQCKLLVFDAASTFSSRPVILFLTSFGLLLLIGASSLVVAIFQRIVSSSSVQRQSDDATHGRVCSPVVNANSVMMEIGQNNNWDQLLFSSTDGSKRSRQQLMTSLGLVDGNNSTQQQQFGADNNNSANRIIRQQERWNALVHSMRRRRQLIWCVMCIFVVSVLFDYGPYIAAVIVATLQAHVAEYIAAILPPTLAALSSLLLSLVVFALHPAFRRALANNNTATTNFSHVDLLYDVSSPSGTTSPLSSSSNNTTNTAAAPDSVDSSVIITSQQHPRVSQVVVPRTANRQQQSEDDDIHRPKYNSSGFATTPSPPQQPLSSSSSSIAAEHNSSSSSIIVNDIDQQQQQQQVMRRPKNLSNARPLRTYVLDSGQQCAPTNKFEYAYNNQVNSGQRPVAVAATKNHYHVTSFDKSPIFNIDQRRVQLISNLIQSQEVPQPRYYGHYHGGGGHVHGGTMSNAWKRFSMTSFNSLEGLLRTTNSRQSDRSNRSDATTAYNHQQQQFYRPAAAAADPAYCMHRYLYNPYSNNNQQQQQQYKRHSSCFGAVPEEPIFVVAPLYEANVVTKLSQSAGKPPLMAASSAATTASAGSNSSSSCSSEADSNSVVIAAVESSKPTTGGNSSKQHRQSAAAVRRRIKKFASNGAMAGSGVEDPTKSWKYIAHSRSDQQQRSSADNNLQHQRQLEMIPNNRITQTGMLLGRRGYGSHIDISRHASASEMTHEDGHVKPQAAKRFSYHLPNVITPLTTTDNTTRNNAAGLLQQQQHKNDNNKRATTIETSIHTIDDIVCSQALQQQESATAAKPYLFSSANDSDADDNNNCEKGADDQRPSSLRQQQITSVQQRARLQQFLYNGQLENATTVNNNNNNNHTKSPPQSAQPVGVRHTNGFNNWLATTAVSPYGVAPAVARRTTTRAVIPASSASAALPSRRAASFAVARATPHNAILARLHRGGGLERSPSSTHI